MEPSPRDAPCRSPHRPGRLRHGARTARVAWALVRGDGGLAGLGLMYAALATLLWAFATRVDAVVPRLVVFFPVSCLCVLVAVALCFVAAEALAGRSCGIGEALAAARTRARSVVAFALVAGVVALGLGALVRSGFGAGGLVAVLGSAWVLATMFVAPEVALRGSGVPVALRRSALTCGRWWREALAGAIAIGACAFIALIAPAAVLSASSAPAPRLLGFVLLGVVVTLAQATWSAFTVVLHRDATGAATELPASLPTPFWRNPLQRRGWIAWSTAIVVTVVFVGAVLVAQREDPRHRYDVEQPALAVPNVLPFSLANRDQIHEGTGIYWFREAAGTVRRSWVRGDVLLVEVLLEPRFIPRAEAGGFQVNEEDGSVWISIIPTGLT